MKTPPYNLEAEQSLIGTILQSQDAAAIAMASVRPEHFHDQRNRQIMEVCQLLFSQQRSIDIVTVSDLCSKHPSPVPMSYVAGLTDVVPFTGAVADYCRIIREKAKARGLIDLASRSIQQCYTHQIADVLDDFGGGFFKLCADENKHAVRIGDVLPSVLHEIVERQNGTFQGGISTGYEALDRRWNGLSRKDLIIVAARPSMGKTAIAMNIAEHVCEQGRKVMVFSLEMGAQSLSMRMLSSQARVSGDAIRKGYVAENEWVKLSRASGRIAGWHLVVDESSGISVTELASRAKVEAIKGRIDLVVVDYLQLLSGKGENRVQEVSDISRSLKALAKALDCPVLALSQLNRGLESRTDKRPVMSDLRESGAIEQDADIIAFIYRDEVYNKSPDNPMRGLAEIITAKQRNGPTGVDELVFAGEFSRFDTYARAI